MHTDWTGNVLDELLAHVLEAEAQLVAHLLVHDARNHDPAGIGEGLQPCRDVDAVAKNIASVDYDVADIDTDSKLDALFDRHVGIAIGHSTLNIDGAAHSIDNADELHQNPVARRLDDTAAMLGDLRVDQFLAMDLEIVKRTLFIARHEPAVAGNITSQYRGKSALDAIVTHAELTWSPNRKRPVYTRD